MANEIRANVSLTVAKGNIATTRSTNNTVTMSGSVYAQGVQSIPTTANGTAISVGSVATAGWAYFRNLDAANYVEIGVQTGGTFYPTLKLLAGEACLVRLTTNAPYAQANTAAVLLDYTLISN